ncbi:flagellar basal body rod modification protein [Aquicoccus sp. SCR17]|nr:flagellar basal body rod modification protein [Carideicomes alvinocaridis]
MNQVDNAAAAQAGAGPRGTNSGSNPGASAGAATEAGKEAGTGTAISGDFETFLRMLTTQITNQDPLDPMDSADFAVQLATFSGVEQQVLTNQLLEGLTARIGASDMVGMAGWIGKEVRAPGFGYHDGQPLQVTLPRHEAADEAVLVIRDAGGAEVARMSLPLSQETLYWDGRDAAGQLLPDGNYAFEVEHFKQGEELGVTAAQPYGRVIEARGEADGLMLVLEGGTSVPASDVTALRAAADLSAT